MRGLADQADSADLTDGDDPSTLGVPDAQFQRREDARPVARPGEKPDDAHQPQNEQGSELVEAGLGAARGTRHDSRHPGCDHYAGESDTEPCERTPAAPGVPFTRPSRPHRPQY